MQYNFFIVFLPVGNCILINNHRLEAMYKSLHILVSLPGDEDRQTQFKNLRETVLSNLRPRVQNDVNNNDLTSLQEYFHIYEKLGKKEELQQEYTVLRAKSLHYIWTVAPVADLIGAVTTTATAGLGGASIDSTPVKQQTAMAVAISMVAVKPSMFAAQWIDWLDKLEHGVANLLTRSHDDIVVLFNSSTEATDVASTTSSTSISNSNSNSNKYYSTILCNILLSALNQLPVVLLNVFQQMRSIQNTPTGATDLCYNTFVKIDAIVGKFVYTHLQYANDTDMLACLHMFYGAFITWSGLSVQFSVQEGTSANTSAGTHTGHYIADINRSITHVLLNQKKSLQQLRFDVLINAQNSDNSNAGSGVSVSPGAGASVASTNMIVISDSIDVSELFITFNDLLLSCSNFSAQEAQTYSDGNDNRGEGGGAILDDYLNRIVGFVRGIALKPMLSNLVTVLVLYIQQFANRLRDLRAAFGLPLGIIEDTESSSNASGVSTTPVKAGSAFSTQRAAGSSHGDVTSILWAEKLSQKMQQQSGDLGSQDSQGLGGGIYALGMNVSEMVFIPSALKALQATGRLVRTLVRFEQKCVSQVVALGNELQALLSIPGSVDIVAPVAAVVDAASSPRRERQHLKTKPNPALDVVVQKLCQNNGSFARDLVGFIHLHSAPARDAHNSSANLFVAIFEELEVLKRVVGGTVVDLFMRTPVRHFAQLSADSTLWAAPSPSDGNRLIDQVPQTAFTLYGEYMLTVIHEIESFVINFNSMGETEIEDERSDGSGGGHVGLMDILCLNSQQLCITLTARYWARLGSASASKSGSEGLCTPATAHPAIQVVETVLFGGPLVGEEAEAEAEAIEDSEWADSSASLVEEIVVPLNKYQMLKNYYSGRSNTTVSVALAEGDNETDIVAVTPLAELEDDFIAHYVSNWCAAVNSSLLGVIFSEVYAIPALSALGLQQLKTDLIYTQNVANTLGIRPHPLLTHTINVIGRITGDLDCCDSGYMTAVGSLVTEKTVQVLNECATANAKDGAIVLLSELTLKLLVSVAEGHQIKLN